MSQGDGISQLPSDVIHRLRLRNKYADSDIVSIDDQIAMVITMHDATFGDPEYEALLHNIRSFLNVVCEHRTRYHFIIDMHNIEAIPYLRLLQMHRFLNRRKDIFSTFLHCSIVITQSAAMKTLVDWSMMTLYTPTRPFACLVARPPQQLNDTLRVPESLVSEMRQFM